MLQLLDLAGIYFRAFFAVPGSVTVPDGKPVNASAARWTSSGGSSRTAGPTQLVACLDLDWRPAFRVAAIPSYKTHRVLVSAPPVRGVAQEVVPDELSPQVPVLLDILGAIGIALAGAEGYEADDVIGTLADAPGPPGRGRHRRPRPDAAGHRRRPAGPDPLHRRRDGQDRGADGAPRSRPSTASRPPGTPTSRRCAATRPTGCPGCPASATRPPRR